MAQLAFLISLVALGIAILAYQEAGGTKELLEEGGDPPRGSPPRDGGRSRKLGEGAPVRPSRSKSKP